MIRSNDVHEKFKILIQSFEPSYLIHLTQNNIIMNFDQQLVADFQTKFAGYEDFVGLNLIELITKDKRFGGFFAKSFSDVVNNYGTGLCAINTSFRHRTSNIPVIYVLLVMVEKKTIAQNIVKELKIYNYIEMAKLFSDILNKNMFEPFTQLTNSFQENVTEKSIFFAFESLKYFANFISSEVAAKNNQQQLADVLFPFHRTRTNEINQRFVNELLRANGYVEYDKNRQIQEQSLELLEDIITQNFIPFNTIDRNRIVRIR